MCSNLGIFGTEMTSRLSQGARKGPSTKWALCICEQPQQNNTFTHSHAVLLSSANHLTSVSYAVCYTRYSHLLRQCLMVALWQLVGLAVLLGSCPHNHCSLASCRGGHGVEEGQQMLVHLFCGRWSWIPSPICHSWADWQTFSLHLENTQGLHHRGERRWGGSRLLLCCLSEIPGPQHNHDNCSSAIRGLSTQRQLQPEERNGRQKTEVENCQEVGDFAACVVKINASNHCQGGTLSSWAHLDQPLGSRLLLLFSATLQHDSWQKNYQM